MKALRCLVACFAMLVLPAAAMAEQPLMKETKTFGEDLTKAMLAGDVDTLMGMYADDVISLPNYGPRMEGKEALKKHHQQMSAMGMKITSFTSEPTEAWQAGDEVIEIGTFAISLTIEGMPQPITDKGKYVNVYARDQDGSLKIKVETWNTDVDPMAGSDHSHE